MSFLFAVILASWQKGVIVAFVLIPIAGAVALALWWFLCKKKKGNEWFPSICDKCITAKLAFVSGAKAVG